MSALVQTMLFARSLTAALPRVKGLGVALGAVAALFRRWSVDVEVTVFGSRMQLNSSDHIGNMLLFTPNYYDRRERELIRSIVSVGDYVVDVGANIGTYTLLLARLTGPSGLVTSVEAEQGNAAVLRHNISLNGLSWVAAHQCGVSDRRETLALHLDADGNAGGHSFCAVDHLHGPEQNVSCVPLADLLDREKKPKFMKLDIEGFEYRVLKRYFEDVPSARWPEYLMIEEVDCFREGNPVELAVKRGYRILERCNFNVFLVRD